MTPFVHPFVEFCISQNMTLNQLAEQLNINVVTLYRIRKGKSSITMVKILEWCKENQIDPFEVFCVNASSDPASKDYQAA